jgi:hypothetical protein
LLDHCAPPRSLSDQIVSDASAPEHTLFDGHHTSALRAPQLTLSVTTDTPAGPSPAGEQPTSVTRVAPPARRRVGQRNPRRDPIGVPEHVT